MRTLLPSCALLAAAALSAPAAAQSWAGGSTSDRNGHLSDGRDRDGRHGDHWRGRDGRGGRDGLNGRDRRDRHFSETVNVGYYGLDFDGNRSFDADRWNDWWHERPYRSYPRWVQQNDRCERLWWSGGGWRC